MGLLQGAQSVVGQFKRAWDVHGVVRGGTEYACGSCRLRGGHRGGSRGACQGRQS